MISIIIVSYNTQGYLREVLASVQTFCLGNIEIIVVDNASVDGSPEMVAAEFSQVKLIQSGQNLGFGRANNLGVQHAKGEFVCLLNSDAVLSSDAVSVLANYLSQHPEVACVGPKILLPDFVTPQPQAFGYAPSLKTLTMQALRLNTLLPNAAWSRGIDGIYQAVAEHAVGWLSGVCMMIRREDYVAVGGFDARFFMYCEDIELCMKLSERGGIVVLNSTAIMHYGGASSKGLAAKIRNSLWQQRHLLMIMADHNGPLKMRIAKVMIAVGLIMRIAVGVIYIPTQGIKNTTLQTAWARLCDLFLRIKT